MKLAKHFAPALLAAASLLAPIASNAEDASAYPARPITFVVPFAAGGALDILARLLAERLTAQTHQSVVVDNKPGANGNLAMDYVAHAQPDGYTIMIGSNGLATNTALYPKLPFSITGDLAPVAYVGYAPLLLLVPAASPFTSVKGVVDAARSAPGTLTFASAGGGSSGHLAAEMLKDVAKVDITHVPYKGGAPALVDLMAGRVTFMLLDTAQAMPHLKAGRLRALAVGGPHRVAALPEVPTLAEAGFGSVDAAVWWGIVVPAKTPAAVIAKLNNEIDTALTTPSVKARLGELGVTSDPGSPEQFARYWHEQNDKWTKTIQRARIQLD
jgi:tripartite-type tricarboxylate transporter receptor subunit TctC